jgi:hypothetical protein
VAIGVRNDGERAAGETLVNVIVPRDLPARWSQAGGEEIPGGDQAAGTHELLPDAKGEMTVESKYLSSTWPRVGLRSDYEKYVQFPVGLPSPESAFQQTTVPIRVTVQADEIPDDIKEYVVRHVVRVARRGGS